MGTTTLIIYRGASAKVPEIQEATRQVLGGHIRPDAHLAVQGSAPIRVDSRLGESGDPLAGTVRVLHLAVDRELQSILTNVSSLVLRNLLGFPPELAEEAWESFGHAPSEAVARLLSEGGRSVAAVSLAEEEVLLGSYAIFSGGRRLWSAVYRPADSYATWDGQDLRVESMGHRDPLPVEGSPPEFAAHGLNLLFQNPLHLTASERHNLLPSLWRACRPPVADAVGAWLVRDGQFIEPEPLGPEDWDRFTASFSC